MGARPSVRRTPITRISSYDMAARYGLGSRQRTGKVILTAPSDIMLTAQYDRDCAVGKRRGCAWCGENRCRQTIECPLREQSIDVVTRLREHPREQGKRTRSVT